MGRKTSVEEKLLKGNPGHRQLTNPQPPFQPGDNLAPPERWPQDGFERQEWHRVVPELQRLGIAKAIHQGLLQHICELYATKVSCYAAGDHRGARLAGESYRRLLSDFLGPIGRPRAEPSEADEFFDGPRLTP